MPSTGDQIKPQIFHEFIRDKIDTSCIKQKDMAEELGLSTPNIITMFKQGKTRVPLERVPGLAKVLGIDPKVLIKMAMLEYCPDLYRVIEKIFGGIITKNEQVILDEIRKLSQERDPAITSKRHKEAVEEFVKKLMTR